MSDDFLDEFLADPFDNESGGSFEDIALIHVTFAWQAGKYEWGNDTRTYFPFGASKEAMAQEKENCQAYIDENNLDGFPKLGVLIEIPIETFLTAHEKMTWDVQQFTNSFFAAKFQLDRPGKGLDRDQQARVKGLLPYDMVVKSVNEHRQCLSGSVWARLSQEVNWYTEAIEQRKNEDYPNRVYIIQEIFESKEAAYAAAGKSIEDDFGGDDTSGLSEYAITNGWTLETLKEQSQNIHNAIASALKGENTPNNKPMNNDAAIKMVCAAYVIEQADLKLLDVEIAF